jgi:hypothetical protein
MTRARDVADTQDNLGGPVPPVTAGKNAFYNSGFEIAQRGTSFTGLGAVDQTLDRWVYWATTGGQSNYASRQSAGNLSVTPNQVIRYCGRFGRTAGSTNTGGRQVFQTLETSDSIRFAGKTVTVSFYARKGADYSQSSSQLAFDLVYGTGTDQIYYSFTGLSGVASGLVTLTSSWQRFSITGVVPTNATQLAATWTFAPLGTAGANDYFEITGAQLEESSVATPYSRQNPTIQGELAACQRYYYRESGPAGGITTGFGTAYSTTNFFSVVKSKVTMRVNPTSIDYSNLQAVNASTGLAASSAILWSGSSTSDAPALLLTTAGTFAVQSPWALGFSATGYIAFSAEL